MSISPKFLTTAAEAARVLALSRRQFDRLVKTGVLSAYAPRQFDLGAVVPAFISYVEQGRHGAATIAEAKLLTERERARKLALENRARAGELVCATHVASALAELASMLVQDTEAIPGRHADELVAIADRSIMRQRLLTIVRELRSRYATHIDTLATRLASG